MSSLAFIGSHDFSSLLSPHNFRLKIPMPFSGWTYLFQTGLSTKEMAASVGCTVETINNYKKIVMESGL